METDLRPRKEAAQRVRRGSLACFWGHPGCQRHPRENPLDSPPALPWPPGTAMVTAMDGRVFIPSPWSLAALGRWPSCKTGCPSQEESRKALLPVVIHTQEGQEQRRAPKLRTW